MTGIERAIRASDEEREEITRLLGDHLATGRLDLEEFDTRTTAALKARTRGELDALLSDLPQQRTRRRRGWWRRKNRGEWTADGQRKGRLRWNPDQELREWGVVAVWCLGIWGGTALLSWETYYFWPAWVIVPWGLILLFSGQAKVLRREKPASD